MIKYIKNGTQIFLVLLLMFGCNVDDLVNENKPTLEGLLGSAENVESLLVGTYSFSASRNSYGGQINLASELIGNTNELEWRGSSTDGVEYVNKNMTPPNGMVTDLMSDIYDAINEANTVLLGLNLFEDQITRERIEGEARFLRALNHFDLVRFYAKQYVAGQNNNQLGITLLTTSSLENLFFNPRNTVEEVYDHIINDLTIASNLLPNSNTIFADKYAAEALLARVYTQQGNFAAARNSANNVITNSTHSLESTFDEAFGNNNNSSEDLFSLQITDANGNSFSAMNTFWATQGNGGRIGNPDIAVNQSFIDTYDSNDSRGQFFYTVGSSGIATTKWKEEFAVVLPIIRLSEMYLIRAESNFRLNSSTGATPLDDINTIRTRANAPILSSVTLNDIISERKFELAFEGHLLHDIKRLGLTAGGLNADDNKLVMPIPLDELNSNGNSEQNPGY